MWSFADRIAKMISDMTVGTVIVLVHIVLADRDSRRARESHRAQRIDGDRTWRSQISP